MLLTRFSRGIFLSTLSLRRATVLRLLGWLRVLISIHALLAESDHAKKKSTRQIKHFYPRSPCGERLITIITICIVSKFLSTLSLRRATNERPETRQRDAISIHALLAESDYVPVIALRVTSNFYPRSPCGERHCIIDIINNVLNHFYPRSPCGERQAQDLKIPPLRDFYPRSPCGERLVHALELANTMLFLSTLSLRRATLFFCFIIVYAKISIHALLAESDGIGLVFLWWGVRFLSTLSLRRATPSTD